MFRGEFIGLSGGADFYATNVKALKKEGAQSLNVYLDACQKKGIAPYRSYSGKFNVRVSPELHAQAARIAAAENLSLNELVAIAIKEHTAHA